MTAIVLDITGLHLQEIPSPECPSGSVRVRLIAAALNHRDQYIMEGKYSKIVLPAVLGSDGVGIVEEAPSNPMLLGMRVVIDPSIDWGSDPKAQGKSFSILGMPLQGTFASEVVVPASSVYAAPDHLSDMEAAALPVVGVTAYRALVRQGALDSGQTVFITGIGGGVATTLLQFAVSIGARVIVGSTSDEKIKRAISLGATAGFNVTEDDWAQRVIEAGPVDLIVDSVGGDTINHLANILRPGGRLVSYGSSRGIVPEFNMHRVFWKQIQMIGSTMGTSQDFSDMLDFVRDAQISTIVDSVFDLAQAQEAFDRLRDSKQFGKIILRCS